jgi:inner membrane transporter RhtA
MTATELRAVQVPGRGGPRLPAPLWVLAGIASAQLGAAAATPLFRHLGPLGTGWLRLSWAAILLVCTVRPKVWRMPGRDVGMTAVLGVVNATMMLAFFQAIDRLPLGTAAALSFLGPLSVAVFKARNRLGLIWPAIAMIGVLALTQPWSGTVNTAGIAFALLDGLGWALYIMLTQHLGSRFDGSEGLAISMVVAAIVATIVGAPQAIGHLTPSIVAIGAAIAVLSPIFTFSMELAALRRLNAATFGTLMCLEPAIGLLVGLVFLRQIPSVLQGLGVLLVVLAAVGAERHGRATASVIGTVHSS